MQVVFAEGVLFSVMSFYASQRSEFLLLFMLLLALDLLWCIAIHQFHTNSSVATYERWLLNNLIALIALATCYFVYQQQQHVLVLDIGAGVIAVNTLVDFAVTWKFYFPLPRSP